MIVDLHVYNAAFGILKRNMKRDNDAWNVFTNITERKHEDVSIEPVVRKRRKTEKAVDPLFAAERNFMKAKVNATHLETQLDSMQPFDFPFVKELLLAAPKDSMAPNEMENKEQRRRKTEVVERQYEETFLREPINNERGCALGDDCEGFKVIDSNMANAGFVLREFLLPSQMQVFKSSGTWPTEPSLCLMCKRAEIAKAYYNIKADGMCVKSDVTLQDYQNLVGIKGEYRIQDCILSSSHSYQGLLFPIVQHSRTAYKLKTMGGINYYVQWNYPTPIEDQDFRLAL